MANFQSENVQAHRPAVTTDDSEVVAVTGSFALTGALVAADTVELVKLPAGCVIVDAILYSSAAIAAATLSVGGNAIIGTNAVTTAGAGLDRMDSTAATDAGPAATEQNVVLTSTAGGGLTADVVSATILYRNSRYGA